ncbi:MAG: 16S rRNA (cytosine967-C5)-methyltransferase [Limisphaerales bacterium]
MKPAKQGPANQGLESRAGAARGLSQVIKHNRTIDWVEMNHADWQATPLSRELLYGSCRHFYSLSAKVDRCLSKPLRGKDHHVYTLLLVGAYQLAHTRIKAHAVLQETVSTCVTLKRPWAKGLVNAVLRKLIDIKTEQSFELPDWLISTLRQQYADNADALMQACLTRAPMALRVTGMDQASTPTSNYQTLLSEQGLSFRETTLTESLILDQPITAESLPGWQTGAVAVQDFGAQLVGDVCARVLSSFDGPARMLDSCSAPGGKLFHTMERCRDQGASYLALDMSEARINTIQTIGARLNHSINCTQADATQLDWWDKIPFQLILLDAPCTGTGTLRRHPDIKILLEEDDIPVHANTQLQLLDNLWSTLAPGGTLLYCTCSVLAAENDDVIRNFISLLANQATQTMIQIDPLVLSSGHATELGWQMLPTDTDTDGFYLASLTKVVAETTLEGTPVLVGDKAE